MNHAHRKNMLQIPGRTFLYTGGFQPEVSFFTSEAFVTVMPTACCTSYMALQTCSSIAVITIRAFRDTHLICTDNNIITIIVTLQLLQYDDNNHEKIITVIIIKGNVEERKPWNAAQLYPCLLEFSSHALHIGYFNGTSLIRTQVISNTIMVDIV